MTENICRNLENVKKRIFNICKKYNRKKESIMLLAVSKNQNIKNIKNAISYGQLYFAENYVQESIIKIQKLKKYSKIEWHFIGSIQSNKTRLIAENFSWCHSIDSIYIAKRLNTQRPKNLFPLNVLIQINIDNESNKSGIILDKLPNFIKKISVLKNLKIRGIMAIPKKENIYTKNIKSYQLMENTLKRLKKHNLSFDSLSIGTSDDLEIAVAFGSTILRIGKAIFGLQK